MDNLDLRELYYILRKGVKWLILFAIIGGIIAACVSVFLIDKQYQSSVSLYVDTASEKEETNLNTITASQKVVNSYIVLLKDDETLEQVTELLSQTISAAGVRSSLAITSTTDTQILTIASKTTDPQLSADICNALADIAPSIFSKYVGKGNVLLIGAGATASAQPASPNVKQNILLGILTGLLLTAFILIIIYICDNTVKGEADVKTHLNIPVLGEIPSFDESAKRGKRYGR